MKEPLILAAVQWHVGAGKQAKTTGVDLGLGPEPPVLFLKRPLASDYRLLPSPALSKGESEGPVAAQVIQVCCACHSCLYLPETTERMAV